MYSLNVPPPSPVTALAGRLARDIPRAQPRPRGEHTLVCKRLGNGDPSRIASQVRDPLIGTAPFELQVTGIDLFEDPTSGSAPVVYLAVESLGLQRLHDAFCEVFEPVENLEGDGYTPHVTIARDGDLAAARRLAERDIDPIRWTAETVVVWDSKRSLAVREFSLPV